MNKVILMGRLTRDPEMRYTSSDMPMAVARFSLAVDRRFRREGEPTADFINCVAFGKSGEFIEKYFKKGQLVSVVGRLSVRNWEDQTGQKRVSTEVIVEEQFFAESKSSFEARTSSESRSATYGAPSYMDAPPPPPPQQQPPRPPQNIQPNISDGFYPIDEHIDEDDLPF